MIGQAEKDAVMRVMERGILSGYQGNWSDNFYGGTEIQALEREWQEYFGVKHAITCNSATSGLWLACSAIGLNHNFNKVQQMTYYKMDPCKFPESIMLAEYHPDEVIVTPYSMTCSASIPLHFGAKPVFADIEKDYYCLDPKSVERAITERTRAIIVVDLFGQPYDAEYMYYIAEKYGKKYGHKIYVIEDAAQAIGAKYKGYFAGTLGDIGVYSLNRHKHIQCGEGGIVVTDNDELAIKIRLAMNHSEAVVNDISKKDNRADILKYPPPFSLVGMNMRMTELSAAIAREQLKKLDSILENIREHAKYFPVKVRPGCEHSYYRYAYDKNSELNAFRLNGIVNNLDDYNFKNHYITPLFKLPLFKSLGYDQEQCPICQKTEEDIVLAWLKGSDM